MEKGTTYVALDDSKRKIVAGILRPDATQPELREIPNEPHHVRRLFERLTREGAVGACYEAGVSGYDLYRDRQRRSHWAQRHPHRLLAVIDGERAARGIIAALRRTPARAPRSRPPARRRPSPSGD
jgi:hypothetical protein